MAEPIIIVHIRNEDEAWKELAQALGDGFPPETVPVFVFEGWPKITIGLPRTPIDGSISPSMMEAFLELQKTIYRAHAFLTADTGDLRTLTKKEKEDLEFRVKVEKGSSNYEIDLNTILDKLGTEALNKMDSTHIVITVLGLAVVIGGVVAFKAWLQTKTEQRKSELDDSQKKEWLTLQLASIEQDTKRLGILSDAMSRQPILLEVEASADAARQGIIRAIGEERGGTISGVEIGSEFASEIVTQKRQQGQDIRLAGTYRVAKVDTTSPDGFRVTLTDVKSGAEVTAAMLDVMVSEEHRQLIQTAEWTKSPVFVEMTARRLRNRMVDAVVRNVREATPAEATSAADSRE